MGAYKKFSEQLYRTNDEPARDTLREWFKSQGLDARNNDDLYGPDIIVYFQGFPIFYAEVEVKQAWRKEHKLMFPFATIQLPQRKEKFMQLGLMIQFYILRQDLKAAVLIPEHEVTSDRLVEVPNKYISEGELFFQIPVDECLIVSLEE